MGATVRFFFYKIRHVCTPSEFCPWKVNTINKYRNVVGTNYDDHWPRPHSWYWVKSVLALALVFAPVNILKITY